jgi:hypothetical protein
MTGPAARDTAAAVVLADGWTVEYQGRYPGVRRMLVCWAGAPVAAVAVVHAATATGTGMVPALSAAAATGTALIALGAATTVRATARADARAAARAARVVDDAVTTAPPLAAGPAGPARGHVPWAAAWTTPAPRAAAPRHQTTTRRPA